MSLAVKGNLAPVLDAAGIRNATATGTITGAPIALRLNELVYRGAADLAVKSQQGKKATAKLVQ